MLVFGGVKAFVKRGWCGLFPERCTKNLQALNSLMRPFLCGILAKAAKNYTPEV